MRKMLIAVMCIGVAIAACKKENSNVPSTTQPEHSVAHYAARASDSAEVFSTFIPKDVANTMINSYVTSLNGNGAATSTNSGSGSTSAQNNLKSFSIDADTLRAYLSDPNVKSVKLIFAHTMDYINAGNAGVFSGMQSGAMTIVIAAYDVSGNYVYYNNNYVLDHAIPCPYTCPPGAAGGDMLQ